MIILVLFFKGNKLVVYIRDLVDEWRLDFQFRYILSSTAAKTPQ